MSTKKRPPRVVTRVRLEIEYERLVDDPKGGPFRRIIRFADESSTVGSDPAKPVPQQFIEKCQEWLDDEHDEEKFLAEQKEARRG